MTPNFDPQFEGVLSRQDVYDAADTGSHHQSRAGHR